MMMFCPQQTLDSLLQSILSGNQIEISDLSVCLQEVLKEQRLHLLRNTRSTFRRNTVIHHATMTGQTIIIKYLLEDMSADQQLNLLELKDEYGNTVINIAASMGQTYIIKCLLSDSSEEQRLALFKTQNEKGLTATHFAAGKGHANFLRCLTHVTPVEHRFDVLKMRDVLGSTALHYAALNNHQDVIRHIENQLSPEEWMELLNITNNGGQTAIQMAAMRRTPNAVNYLRDCKLLIDEKIPYAAERSKSPESRELIQRLEKTEIEAEQLRTTNNTLRRCFRKSQKQKAKQAKELRELQRRCAVQENQLKLVNSKTMNLSERVRDHGDRLKVVEQDAVKLKSSNADRSRLNRRVNKQNSEQSRELRLVKTRLTANEKDVKGLRRTVNSQANSQRESVSHATDTLLAVCGEIDRDQGDTIHNLIETDRDLDDRLTGLRNSVEWNENRILDIQGPSQQTVDQQ